MGGAHAFPKCLFNTSHLMKGSRLIQSYFVSPYGVQPHNMLTASRHRERGWSVFPIGAKGPQEKIGSNITAPVLVMAE